MPATVSRSVRSTHASAAADVLETSAAAARKRLCSPRASLASKKKRRPRVSALVDRLEALLLSGASRASTPVLDGIRRASRRSRHRRPRRLPSSQAASDGAPRHRAPDAERRELTASKTPEWRVGRPVHDVAFDFRSRPRPRPKTEPLATRPSERSNRAPRCPRAVQHDAQDHARVRRRDSFARPPSPNRETDRVPLIAPSVRNASPGPRRRRSSPGWAHRHLRDVHHRENASFSRARDPSHDLAFVAVHSAFQPRAELGAGRGGVEPSSAPRGAVLRRPSRHVRIQLAGVRATSRGTPRARRRYARRASSRGRVRGEWTNREARFRRLARVHVGAGRGRGRRGDERGGKQTLIPRVGR